MDDQTALDFETRLRDDAELLKDYRCLHCGNGLDETGYVHSSAGLFCCNGCRFVYNLLNDLGLDDFYKLRDNNNLEPASAVFDNGEFSYLNQDNFKQLYRTDEDDHCMRFYIEGISCTACLWLIEKTSDIVPEIENVTLNMSSNVATVSYSNDESYSTFPETVNRFGFRAFPLAAGDGSEKYKTRENRNYLYKIGVAGVCAGNIMLLSAAKYSGATGTFAKYFDLTGLLLSVPVITYSASVFYRNFYYSVINKRPSVDIPVVFVVVAGWILSVFNYTVNGEVYFDSVSLFVFLLLGSRYLLNNLHERINTMHIPGLSMFSDRKARVFSTKTGEYELKPVESVNPGDRVKQIKGERVLVDGVLVSDNACLNLSVLTGESIPVYASRGDYVYAGTVAESEEVVIEAEKAADQSRISKLIKGIADSTALKSSYSGTSDRYSTVFTLLVAVVSIVSFSGFYTFYNADEAFRRTIAFILISCPCAFVFTLPVTITYSLKSALNKGLIIKDNRVLERLKGLKNVLFDKTGTITIGNFSVLQWDTEGLSTEDIRAIISIQKRSGHPVARSMINYLSDFDGTFPEVSEFEYVPARGVRGVVNGEQYGIYAQPGCNSTTGNESQIVTRLVIYKNNEPVSEVFLGDRIRTDAYEVTERLRSRGLTVYLISGDKRNPVESTSNYLKIDPSRRFWEQTPEDKIGIVEEIPRSMFIGDGINDAGAIAAAEVGVSVQGGIEESLRLSDVYILRNDLTSVADLFEHGEITGRTVQRTIYFSLAYNVTAGVLALSGYINPLIAAILMPASSALLVLTSLYMQKSLDRAGAPAA